MVKEHVVRVDADGTIVIPEEIMSKFNLKIGDEIVVEQVFDNVIARGPRV